MNTKIENATKIASTFLVDVEASAPSPMTGVMTEFGVVHAESLDGFYAHLYPFTPHPDIPALPVVEEGSAPSVVIKYYSRQEVISTVDRGDDLAAAARDLTAWITRTCDGRPVMMSDNPGFDAMWMTCFYDALGMSNPFGFSSRRIGDLYAGISRNFTRTSAWKKMRRVKHTHNPLDDALGNAYALRSILGVDE